MTAAAAFAQGPQPTRWWLELEMIGADGERLDPILRPVPVTLLEDSIYIEFRPGVRYAGVRQGDSITIVWGPSPSSSEGRVLRGVIHEDREIRGTWQIRGEWPAGFGARGRWRAVTEPPSRSPRSVRYDPPEYHATWSAANPPGLRAVPGDTILMVTGSHTPAPIYVEGAYPGDALTIEFVSVRPAQLTAVGPGDLIPRYFLPSFAKALEELQYQQEGWQIDTLRNVAVWRDSLERAVEVPVATMLGSVGVAPADGEAIARWKEGIFGGNLDYNRVVQGALVTLPVFVRGGLLSIGDAHAAQGDGELAGMGLEIAASVKFVVNVIEAAAPPAPRVTDEHYLMALGTAGSLDDALRIANSNLASWLQEEYGLALPTLTALLGTALKIDIANVWDDDVTVAARVPRKVLRPFRRR